jgi:hypothetical protein
LRFLLNSARRQSSSLHRQAIQPAATPEKMRTAFRETKTLPAARFDGYTPDAIGFFEAMAIEGLEEQWVRIPASVQRKFFGKVVFGKLGVMVGKNGIVRTMRSVSFGTDWNESRGYYSVACKQFISDSTHLPTSMMAS